MLVRDAAVGEARGRMEGVHESNKQGRGAQKGMERDVTNKDGWGEGDEYCRVEGVEVNDEKAVERGCRRKGRGSVN